MIDAVARALIGLALLGACLSAVFAGFGWLDLRKKTPPRIPSQDTVMFTGYALLLGGFGGGGLMLLVVLAK